MIREIGVTLFLAGLLSLLVMLGAAGHESPIPIASTHSYSITRRVLKGGSYFVLESNRALKAEAIEGYEYVVDCKVDINSPSAIITPSPPGTPKPTQPVPPQPIKNAEGRLYLLSRQDYLKLSLLLSGASTKEEFESYIPLIESRKKLAVNLKEESSSNFQLTMACEPKKLPPGVYYALAIIKVEMQKTQTPTAPPFNRSLFMVDVGSDISLKAVISPTFIQLFRAVDVTVIGALVLGLHIYINREEYRSNRLVRTLRRIYDTLGRRRRRGEEPT